MLNADIRTFKQSIIEFRSDYEKNGPMCDNIEPVYN
jgi:hypothetical protein